MKYGIAFGAIAAVMVSAFALPFAWTQTSSFNYCYFPAYYGGSRHITEFANGCGFSSPAQWKAAISEWRTAKIIKPTPAPTPTITPTLSPIVVTVRDCSGFPYGICPLEPSGGNLATNAVIATGNRHDCPTLPYGLCPMGI